MWLVMHLHRCKRPERKKIFGSVSSIGWELSELHTTPQHGLETNHLGFKLLAYAVHSYRHASFSFFSVHSGTSTAQPFVAPETVTSESYRPDVQNGYTHWSSASKHVLVYT